METIIKISDNIYSPLGNTTEENFSAVMSGISGLKKYYDMFDCVESFTASAMPTRMTFTQMCIESVSQALLGTDIDTTSANVIFVFSTTKGEDLQLWEPAVAVTRHFGNKNLPVIVSNACISGVSAQIMASRLLTAGIYKTAVVIGCDVLSKFIVSGFQSLKALSAEKCRPFAPDRDGLNLGEAAACMILSAVSESKNPNGWIYEVGSMHNDANHISGPSRTAEGSYRCLTDCLDKCNIENLAFISVHGTGTAYNDDMETLALHRAGLESKPILALKVYYGHTLGATGILETIISMQAVEKCMLPTTRTGIHGNSFIKMLSGFGGCNAAVRWSLKK
ncbi:MAG: beta-ketoacyl synthase [Paludibacteraceae bacterium]|nr:beta-ketoacyl synthase [Paludibacteraceae bacterium]